jgi:hypothetical protein
VEHIGFEPMTSSMPWKRASQLRQCPLGLNSNKTEVKNKAKLGAWPYLSCAPTRRRVEICFKIFVSRAAINARTTLRITD